MKTILLQILALLAVTLGSNTLPAQSQYGTSPSKSSATAATAFPRMAWNFRWIGFSQRWDSTSRDEFHYSPTGLVLEQTNHAVYSGTWQPFYHYTFQFDAADRRTAWNRQQWENTVQNWEDSEQDSWEYDSNDNPTKLFSRRWLAHLQTWDTTQFLAHAYTYDPQGRILLRETEWLSANRTRTTFARGTTGELLEMTVTRLDSHGLWQNETRTLYSYDANGQIVAEIEQSWSNGNWENATQSLRTWNILGEMTEQTQLIWDSLGWEPTFKDTYVWHDYAQGLASAHSLYYWWLGAWVHQHQDDYVHGPGRDLVHTYHWPFMPSRPTYRTTTQYDAHDNLSRYLMESQDSLTWKTDADEHYLYDYDSDGNVLVKELHRCAAHCDSIVPFIRTVYGDFVLSAPKPATPVTSELAYWPNPVADYLHVCTAATTHGAQLLLLDLQGKAVVQTIINPGQVVDVDVATLPRGVYILQVGKGEHIASRRVVIQ